MNPDVLKKATEINDTIKARESFLRSIKYSLTSCVNVRVTLDITRSDRRPETLYLTRNDIRPCLENLIPKLESEIESLKKELNDL